MIEYVMTVIRREWTELREHFEQIMEDYRSRDVCGFDLVTAVPPRGRLAPRSVYRQQERKVSR